MIQQRLLALFLIGLQTYVVWDLRQVVVIPVTAIVLATIGAPYLIRLPLRSVPSHANMLDFTAASAMVVS